MRSSKKLWLLEKYSISNCISASQKALKFAEHVNDTKAIIIAIKKKKSAYNLVSMVIILVLKFYLVVFSFLLRPFPFNNKTLKFEIISLYSLYYIYFVLRIFWVIICSFLRLPSTWVPDTCCTVFHWVFMVVIDLYFFLFVHKSPIDNIPVFSKT